MCDMWLQVTLQTQLRGHHAKDYDNINTLLHGIFVTCYLTLKANEVYFICYTFSSASQNISPSQLGKFFLWPHHLLHTEQNDCEKFECGLKSVVTIVAMVTMYEGVIK